MLPIGSVGITVAVGLGENGVGLAPWSQAGAAADALCGWLRMDASIPHSRKEYAPKFGSQHVYSRIPCPIARLAPTPQSAAAIRGTHPSTSGKVQGQALKYLETVAKVLSSGKTPPAARPIMVAEILDFLSRQAANSGRRTWAMRSRAEILGAFTRGKFGLDADHSNCRAEARLRALGLAHTFHSPPLELCRLPNSGVL